MRRVALMAALLATAASCAGSGQQRVANRPTDKGALMECRDILWWNMFERTERPPTTNWGPFSVFTPITKIPKQAPGAIMVADMDHLPHELLHAALFLDGAPGNADHTHPAWQTLGENPCGGGHGSVLDCRTR